MELIFFPISRELEMYAPKEKGRHVEATFKISLDYILIDTWRVEEKI